MIVIECDGRAVVISGWRAWAIGAAAVVVTAIVLGAWPFWSSGSR
jgi:hypothetical protein